MYDMIKKMIIIPFLLIGLGITAQNFNKTKLDSLFTIIDQNNKGMGSISIFQNGKEVYANSIGYADIENEIKPDKNTKYRIGSITKTFTATLIMQLVDEQKLSLDTYLGTYFPEVPNANKIKIKHLLRHRSGLFNVTDDKDFVKWALVPSTRKQMMDRIIKKKVDFQPDEKTAYSNTNYLLLSYIAEEIEGKPYSEILTSRIIRPFKLINTQYGKKIETELNEAQSYQLEGENWQQTMLTHMSVPMGAGGIISTSTDLNIFYHNLFSGNIVSEDSLTKMKELVDNLGFGLVKFPFQEAEILGHSGSIDGFQSMVGYFLNDGLAISYTTNGVVIPIETIMIGALKIYLGMEYELPDFKPALTLTSEALDVYLGTYSAPDFPMEINIIKKDNTLLASVKGRPLLPLEPTEIDKFKSDRAMLTMEFIPNENQMIFERGSQKHTLTRK